MRVISEDLAARLAGGATTLAHAWRVERRDGAVFGFTDHDCDLEFDGVTFAAATGMAGAAGESKLGLEPDQARIEGVLSSTAIALADVAAGVWDGARIDVWRVDWTEAALRVHVFAGRIGETRRGEGAYIAELDGLQSAYDAPTGRVYSRFCDAEVGDGRCAVNLTDAAFTGAGLVTRVIGPGRFEASGLEGFAPGWFTQGVLTWSGGAAHEVSAHSAGAGALIELAAPIEIDLGASFTITAGCDKRHQTCQAKFANIVNFRGFPHMPGNDAVQSGPASSGNNGGSRWTG